MFRIGQKVVCIDDSDFIIKKVKKGDIVTIARIYNSLVNGHLMLVFKEHDDKDMAGHRHEYFRPVTYITDEQFSELERELTKKEYETA